MIKNFGIWIPPPIILPLNYQLFSCDVFEPIAVASVCYRDAATIFLPQYLLFCAGNLLFPLRNDFMHSSATGNVIHERPGCARYSELPVR